MAFTLPSGRHVGHHREAHARGRAASPKREHSLGATCLQPFPFSLLTRVLSSRHLSGPIGHHDEPYGPCLLWGGDVESGSPLLELFSF